MPSHFEFLKSGFSKTLSELIINMSEGDARSKNLLEYIGSRKGLAVLHALLTFMDLKHLYGSRIYELFEKICGKDVERFLYHIKMELPCQICGRFVMGMITPLDDPQKIDVYEHSILRQFAAERPNSFWGLKDPPRDPHYSYPIVAQVILATRIVFQKKA